MTFKSEFQIYSITFQIKNTFSKNVPRNIQLSNEAIYTKKFNKQKKLTQQTKHWLTNQHQPSTNGSFIFSVNFELINGR